MLVVIFRLEVPVEVVWVEGCCRAGQKFCGLKFYGLVLVCLLKISVATVGGAKVLNIAHRVGL